eukprot:m.288959 g.288959  ORF g.288959 m.288959 type:complete len:302 (+) comp12054_c0_seq1:96-1001(+)
MAAFASRSVTKKVLSVEQDEGFRSRVRRSIGRRECPNFDPFLMLDEFKGGKGGGFPDHPHRGFETVTYMLPTSTGAFEHEDFCGHKGRLEPGDLQWMTAGRGIVHSEMPAADCDVAHGLQLWINLPSDKKMIPPKYQELKAADIPHVTKDGVTCIVIAGEALGVSSPVYTETPTYYLHFMMEPNSRLEQRIPAEMSSFAYTLEGSACFGGSEPIDAHHTIILSEGSDKDGIVIETKDSKANFVLIAGAPHNEPVFQRGPFVMNTQEQIFEAMADYHKGRNGFENAPGWRSEIGRVITDRFY